MESQFSRTELVLGKEAIDKLKKSKVALFGVGGVGGFAFEALVRSGVGEIDITDSDKVCLSNINRQIIALHSTVGMYKTEVAKMRARDINPDCKVNTHNIFFLPDTADLFDFSSYDYIIDAVDTVSAKLFLVEKAKEKNVPIISSMGAGNKLDPTAFRVADIYQTSVCPLAKVMRRELKKRGIDSLKVVYSEESAVRASEKEATSDDVRRPTPGSVAFVPSVAGLIIAGEVIKDLCGINSD